MTTGAWRSLSPIGLALAAVAGLACQAPLERFEFTEVHMGLPVRMVLYAGSEPSARNGATAGFVRIRELDQILSDYRPDSELNQLSRTANVWVPLGQDLWTILDRALEIARATDGAFDPTIGPLTTLWREARETQLLPDADRLEAARQKTGWRHVDLDPARRAARLAVSDMSLNLGGIAKGFILQEAAAVLRRKGIGRILLEAGGDVVVGDPPPGEPGWSVEVPGADDEFTARARALTHMAIASSGPSVQFVEIGGVRYSHVIDPATGLGLTEAVIVHVIARDAATADALSTALGVVGQQRGAQLLARFPEAHAAFRR